MVTFTGGTFKQSDGTNITTIDGGNIDTGSITANKIKLSGTEAEGGLVSTLRGDGLLIASDLGGTDATAAVAAIRAGTTKANVGLTNVEDKDASDQVAEAFTQVTSLTAGSLFLGAVNTATANYVEISAANGGQIIIADDS